MNKPNMEVRGGKRNRQQGRSSAQDEMNEILNRPPVNTQSVQVARDVPPIDPNDPSRKVPEHELRFDPSLNTSAGVTSSFRVSPLDALRAEPSLGEVAQQFQQPEVAGEEVKPRPLLDMGDGTFIQDGTDHQQAVDQYKAGDIVKAEDLVKSQAEASQSAAAASAESAQASALAAQASAQDAAVKAEDAGTPSAAGAFPLTQTLSEYVNGYKDEDYSDKYLETNLRIVITRFPKGMSDADQVEMTKLFTEDFQSVIGFRSGFSLTHAGGTRYVLDRPHSEPEFSWQERKKKAITKYFDAWGVRIKGQGITDATSFAFIALELDESGTEVVDAWKCEDMYPRTFGGIDSSAVRNRGADKNTWFVTATLGGEVERSPSVLADAQAAWLILNSASKVV